MARTPKRSKPLKDSEIVSLLSDHIKAGIKFTDSKLSKERQRVTDYYNGKLPAPVHGGNSKYVSTDVFDAVESMKATLVETFSVGSDIVKFAPVGEEDVEEARIATEYVKHVLFKQNRGTEIFEDAVHDGLTARVGIAKVYWEECEHEIEEEFDDLTEEALGILLEDPEVELLELTIDEDEPDKLSGKITRKIDKSGVRVENIPPEEFIVNPSIKSLCDAPVTHRTEKTKSELLEDGVSEDTISKIASTDSDLEFDPERIARFDPVAGSSTGLGRSSEDRQDSEKLYVVYETYMKIDMDQVGRSRLWRVVHCGNVVLEKEQVDRHPFITFCPLRTPHSFFGGNFAARVIPTQNAKTVLTRSILDHAVITNNPRYGVVKGALTNPRELIDQRIGGLVNVTRPDGIFPLPQSGLNPFVFQTIGMLDEDKEDVTGVSRLSQGLNKDAISNQNSEGMVEKLIGVSMQRQKAIARAFAHQFVVPLYHEIYKLVVEHESKEKIVEVAGNWVPVIPSAWRSKRDINIELHLGYGEKDRAAEELLTFGQILAQDPVVQAQFQYEQRYNLLKDVFEIKGRKGINKYLIEPAKVQPPQPDPMMVAELELKKQEAETLARKQALAEAEFQHKSAIEKIESDFEQRFKAMQYALDVAENERKDREVDNRIEVSNTEMELAKQTAENAPPENEKASAIISPNG